MFPDKTKVVYFLTGIFLGVIFSSLLSREIKESVIQLFANQNEYPVEVILPDPNQTIHRSCYVLHYDGRTKNASWVYECLTEDCLKGDVSRNNFQFKEDKDIPSIIRTSLSDYKNSGFDRGHLSPAGNNKISHLHMKDSFYLSNISPQDPKFNRGYWSKFEKYVRDLTKSYKTVNVFTGPLYLPKEESDGFRWVKYRVIGESDIAVPTHFFKILMLEKHSGDIVTETYILPNEYIDHKIKISTFKTTIEKVEKASGIVFRKT